MTIWNPNLEDRPGPRYRAIADALAEDVERGALRPGVRLPTHRELAKALRVTVGTVSRAYAEAERRALVKGEVGRGTFVRQAVEAPVSFGALQEEDPARINLGSSLPAIPAHEEERRTLVQAFERLAQQRDLPALLESQPHAGADRHRRAAAAWLAQQGFEAPPERLLVCCGAQHAMAVTLSTLTRPGDVVLTEELTFPGMKGLANLLHLRLRGVAMDGQGVRPEAFEAACASGESQVFYTVPTHHNPTASVMPRQRRQAIAEVAEHHGVTIIEDDIYGFLVEDRPPPLAAFAPRTSCYLTSISKIVAPGFRIGYLAAPEPLVDRLTATVWATAWMAPPPMAEIISGWIEDGTLDRFVGWRRDEAAARNELARRLLPEARFAALPHGYYLWLPLPEPWRTEEFVNQAYRRGVVVTPAEVFVAGRANAPHAVRVSLAAPRSRRRLEEGLTVLAEILADPPVPRVWSA